MKREIIGKVSTELIAAIVIIAIVVSVGIYLGTRPPAAVEEYPTKAITLICPWGAGGGTDRVSRQLASMLEVELGVPVAVVNRTGGHGAVGHGAGALASANGYTLTMVTLEISTMYHMGWTEIKPSDFRGILQINEDPAGLLVHPDEAAAKGWDDATAFLDYVRANPGIDFSGTGTGGIWHLALIGMLLKAGIPVDQADWLPSAGAAEGLSWLKGKAVDAVTCSIVEAGVDIDGGTVKGLATMSEERLAKFPDIPTLKEQGIDWSAGTWRGIAVPRGTPETIVTKLHDAMKKIIDSDDWKNWMKEQGFGMKYRSSDDFDDFMAAQSADWYDVLKAGGLI